MERQVEGLERLIASHHRGELMILNEAINWFFYDSMGEFALNHSFGNIESKRYHEAIMEQFSAPGMLGAVQSAVWLVHFAIAFLPFLPIVQDWFGLVVFCKDRVRDRMQTKSAEPDIAAWFIDEYEDKAYRRNEQQRQDLSDVNSITVIIGGTLTSASNFLAINPEAVEKLYKDLMACENPRNPKVLGELSQLNATINESMRLMPPRLTIGWRDAGPEGLLIHDIFIPPHTTVLPPCYTTARFPSAFEKPDEFLPERWVEKPKVIKDRRASVPFGLEKRGCVRKNLVLIQLRLVLSTIMLRYRVELAPGETGEILWRDMKDQTAAFPGDCRVQFVPR